MNVIDNYYKVFYLYYSLNIKTDILLFYIYKIEKHLYFNIYILIITMNILY